MIIEPRGQGVLKALSTVLSCFLGGTLLTYVTLWPMLSFILCFCDMLLFLSGCGIIHIGVVLL